MLFLVQRRQLSNASVVIKGLTIFLRTTEGVLGFGKLDAVGKSILFLLPQSLCTHELPTPSVGVFLRSGSGK